MSFYFAWSWADSPNDDSNDFGSKCVMDLFEGSFWCKMLELGSKHGNYGLKFNVFLQIYIYLYIKFIDVC